MNNTTTSILSHLGAALVFVPICLPLLFIVAVLASVFFCAVVYERLYVGIKYAIFNNCKTCDFCRIAEVKQEDNAVEVPIDVKEYKWYGRNKNDKDA